MFDFDEYQKEAERTIAAENTEDMVQHGVFGLCSEAGEVAGLFQKKLQGHEIDEMHLAKELGDCLWMIAEICTAYNFSMTDVAVLNTCKLRARYPDGFNSQRSLNRVEGDV